MVETMGNRSLVSVIIPVYNCERYLAEAIESVLAQSYQPIEIIVIDDGSTDGSDQVAKRFSPLVQYFYQPNSGLGVARNSGVNLARGDYLAFLDADDIWMKDKLILQIAAFQGNPGLDFVFGHVQQFISPELDENQKSNLYCPDEKMPGYCAGAMVTKRKSFVRVGSFETNRQIGEFIHWYIRAKEQGMKSFILPEVVLGRRLHTDNMGIRARDSRTDYVRILKASLDRRRASGRIRDNP
jgi:glycosyltransferase involved in cell wall biosynthesis